MDYAAILDVFTRYGAIAIFVLVFLEYMNLPGFPAGIIMPLAGIMAAGNILLNNYFGGWLNLAMIWKLGIFGGLCILGVASFAIAAKISGVLNVFEILKALAQRGKKNA